jgi:hypothetical protein
MTFEAAFQLSLARFDQAVETLRKYVVDPEHVNKESKEMKSAGAEVVYAVDEISRLKDAWATARDHEKKGREQNAKGN